MPSGIYVLGSHAGGRRNLMTLNWATQVSMDPKLVAVGVEAGALTHRLVEEGRVFSLNIIRREDRAVVRKFVKPLDDPGDPGQLGGFAVRTEATGAPVLELAAAWIDCRLQEQVGFGSHTLFIGEIADCGWGDGAEPEGLEVLRMEDTRMSYGG
jgi:flavin reductase (DIM6/NTAB) family NADH-FMN oxidoreductase RutF